MVAKSVINYIIHFLKMTNNLLKKMCISIIWLLWRLCKRAI